MAKWVVVPELDKDGNVLCYRICREGGGPCLTHRYASKEEAEAMAETLNEQEKKHGPIDPKTVPAPENPAPENPAPRPDPEPEEAPA